MNWKTWLICEQTLPQACTLLKIDFAACLPTKIEYKMTFNIYVVQRYLTYVSLWLRSSFLGSIYYTINFWNFFSKNNLGQVDYNNMKILLKHFWNKDFTWNINFSLNLNHQAFLYQSIIFFHLTTANMKTFFFIKKKERSQRKFFILQNTSYINSHWRNSRRNTSLFKTICEFSF